MNIVNEEDIMRIIKADKIFDFIYNEYGPPPDWTRPQGFISLSKIILEQQVSLASANAHYLKLSSYLPGFTPENILSLTDEELRNCQISRQKAKYLRALSAAIVKGDLDIEKLGDQDESGGKDDLKGWLILDSLHYNPADIKGGLLRMKKIQNSEQIISYVQNLNDNYLLRKDLPAYLHYSEISNAIQKKYKLSDTIKLGEVTIIEQKSDWTASPASRSRHYLNGTPDYALKITPLDKGFATAYKLISVKYLSQGNHPPGSYDPRIRAPLFMINGRKADFNEIKSLPIDWVERIDVIKNSGAMVGLKSLVECEGKTKMGLDSTVYRWADGAISIILKEGAEDKKTYHSVSVKFSGYNEPRIFYSPIHRKTLENDYKPDLRTTLLWEPDIRVQAGKDFRLKYFNSDNSSTVRLTLEGITSSGIPVVCNTEYEVK